MFRSVHESSKNILSNEHCILNCLSCKKRHITLFVVLSKQSGNGTKRPDLLSATFFPRPFLVSLLPLLDGAGRTTLEPEHLGPLLGSASEVGASRPPRLPASRRHCTPAMPQLGRRRYSTSLGNVWSVLTVPHLTTHFYSWSRAWGMNVPASSKE
jgi:hypothetical protein